MSNTYIFDTIEECGMVASGEVTLPSHETETVSDAEATQAVKPFTVWSPSQFLSYVEPQGLHLLLPKYLSLGQLTALIGPPGVGKSKLILQLAICQILHKPWCGLDTGGDPQRWLILGDENSIGRVRGDIQAMFSVLTPQERELVEQHLLAQAIVQPDDGDLSLDDPSVFTKMVDTLRATSPSVVALDPLSNFVSQDLSKPENMKQAVSLVRKVVKAGQPQASCLISHHARTGASNTVQAVGFDAGNFGAGGKALLARCRAVINVAPGDDQGRSVVIACGKANDCEKFAPRCAVLDKDSQTYSVDQDWSEDAWKAAVEGKRSGSGSLVNLIEVVETVQGGRCKTKEIVKHLEETLLAKERTVKDLLHRGIKGGYLTKRGHGVYGLGSRADLLLEGKR